MQTIVVEQSLPFGRAPRLTARQVRQLALRALSVASALLAVACGATGVGKPVAQFPSKSALEAVASRSAKPRSPLLTAAVDRYQAEAEIFAPQAPYPNQTGWDRSLIESARQQQSAVHLSAELRCAALEVARFYVVYAAYPDDALRRFLVARCGSTLANVELQTLSFDMPDSATDAAVEAQLRKPAEELTRRLLAKERGELGLGYARGNGRATLIAISGTPLVRLHAFNPQVNGATVALEGDVDRDVGLVTGFITAGKYGVALCEPDRRLKLPSFRMSCPLPEQDAAGTVEIAIGKRNQLFWHVGARALVRRGDSGSLNFDLAPIGSSEAAPNAKDFQQRLLQGLNLARSEAGLSPLAMEVEQSKTNERLVSHFFESAFTGNEGTLDEIGLGLLAGWDVSGMIRTGSIYSGMAESSRNPGRFIAAALESPFGRWVLLEPGMSRIAIGTGALEPSGVMALITTYAFFESQDHRADEAAVFEELNKTRQALSAAPLRRIPSDSALRAALAKITVNAMPSDDALSEALSRTASEQMRSVGGYVLETSDLKHLTFPDQLLGAGPADVEIGITHYRAPGGAWGQYAILFVYFDQSAPTRMAQGKLPSSTQ